MSSSFPPLRGHPAQGRDVAGEQCRDGRHHGPARFHSSRRSVSGRPADRAAVLGLRGVSFVGQYRGEYDSRWQGANSAYLILELRGLGISRRHHSSVMRAVDGLPNAHLVQVVLELFSAIQADHIALAVRLPRLGDRRYRPVRRRWPQRNSRFSTVSIIMLRRGLLNICRQGSPCAAQSAIMETGGVVA